MWAHAPVKHSLLAVVELLCLVLPRLVCSRSRTLVFLLVWGWGVGSLLRGRLPAVSCGFCLVYFDK